MDLKPLASHIPFLQLNRPQEINRQRISSALLISLLITTLTVLCASSSYVAIGSAQSRDRSYSLGASSRPAKANAKRISASKRSPRSVEGLSLDFVTPDRDGGVWLSGNAYLLSGLLVRDGRELQMVTVNGIRMVRAPHFVSPKIGWMTDGESLFQTIDAGGTWTRVDVDDLLGARTLYFTDDQHGWIGGSHGNIYRTRDGGQSWQKRGVGLDYEIRQLFFVDKLHGWAVGNKISAGRPTLSALVKTTDGGDTWQMLSNVNANSPQSVQNIVFTDNKQGWGIDGSQANILHTSDGGRTWTIQLRRKNRGWESLAFVNSQEGWAAGQDGIIHTSDGGDTWEYQLKSQSPLARSLRQITFIDPKRGWAAFHDGALRTTDGGDTWKPISDEWKQWVPAQETLAKHQLNASPGSSAPGGESTPSVVLPDVRKNRNNNDVHQLMQTLEPDNTLRLALEQGLRGDGVHYWWMDMMRTFGIKQAAFEIDFERKVRNTDVKIKGVTHLATYYRYDTAVKDSGTLERIRATGLGQGLESEILSRARKFLTEQTKLPSKEICGKLYMNLLDDEVLPILDEPFDWEPCKPAKVAQQTNIISAVGSLTGELGKPDTSPRGIGIGASQEFSALKIIPRVVSSQYCVGDDELDSLQLNLRLAYVNTSNENVILHIGSPLVTRIMVARTLSDIETKQFEVNSTLTNLTSGGNSCYSGASPTGCFITLPPGGSHETEATTGVFAVRNDARRIHGAVHSGNHVVQIEVATWHESGELARELSTRWRQFGKLWYQRITAEPFAITIERNRVTSDCP